MLSAYPARVQGSLGQTQARALGGALSTLSLPVSLRSAAVPGTSSGGGGGWDSSFLNGRQGAYPCSGELSSGTPTSWAGPGPTLHHVGCLLPWTSRLLSPPPSGHWMWLCLGGRWKMKVTCRLNLGLQGPGHRREACCCCAQAQAPGVLLRQVPQALWRLPGLPRPGLAPRGQPCARLSFQPCAAPGLAPRADTLDPTALTHPALDHHPTPGCAGVRLLLVLMGRTTLPQVSLQLPVCGGPDAPQAPQHTGAAQWEKSVPDLNAQPLWPGLSDTPRTQVE